MAWDLLKKKNKRKKQRILGLLEIPWVPIRLFSIRSKPTISCPVYTGLKETDETVIKKYLGSVFTSFIALNIYSILNL